MIKFPEFNEVEIAHLHKNGRRERNRIVDISEVHNWHGYEEMHRSSARFKNLSEYMNDNRDEKNQPSVSGFGYSDNPVYYDHVVIDIDHPEITPVKNFIKHLENNYSINPFNIGLFFSGNKGFHVLLPSELFGLSPSSNLNKVVKNIAETLTKNIVDIDSQIYTKTSTIRIANTLHRTSGLYKIPLYVSELTTMDSIRAMAVRPRKENYLALPVDGENSTEQLISLGQSITTSLSKKYSFNNIGGTAPKNSRAKKCILEMLKGIKKTNADLGRKNVAFRLAVHMKFEGYPPEVAQGALSGWNELNSPPLPSSIINSVIHSAYKNNYTHTCSDPVYKKYCQHNCYLYKK